MKEKKPDLVKSKLWKKIKCNRTHCIQNNNCILENEWIMARNLSTKISDVARCQYEFKDNNEL